MKKPPLRKTAADCLIAIVMAAGVNVDEFIVDEIQQSVFIVYPATPNALQIVLQ